MKEQEVLHFGSFAIDLSRQILRHGDRDLALRPQSFDVLRHLAERAGTVVSKDQLIEAVWDRRPASDDSVMQCIKDIRQALGEGGHETIKTVSKRGYLFAAGITRTPADRKSESAPPRTDESVSEWRVPRPPIHGRPVLAGITVLFVALASALSVSRDQPSFPIEPMTLMATPSVTVLPFTQANDLPSQQEAFRSLAANIATELTAVGRGYTIQVKTVEVRDADTGPAALRRLGTRYAVLGAVQEGLDTSRVNIRLVETESDHLVWGQMIDAVPAEPDAPSLIATRVAHLIAMQLLAAESHRPLPSAPSAEDYSLLGRARLVGERGAKANREAHALFEKALALDPNSIMAMLGFARTIVDDVLNGWVPMRQHPALLDRAEAMIQRVIELEPRSREGHLQRGILARARKDIDQAVTAFEHTLALSPRYPHAHAELGRALMELGRADEAIAHIRDAIRLSPTDNALYIWCLWAGMAAVHTGDYEAALRWLRTSRQANHSFENTLIWLALAHEGLRQTEEAKPFLAEFMAFRPRFTVSRWTLAPPYRNEVVAQQRSQIAALMFRLGIRQDEAELRSSGEGQQQRSMH
jgi:DNA-binding winged helix-turn-helix (wHTH) protein/tetratricopeptide (TPR) repeat protein